MNCIPKKHAKENDIIDNPYYIIDSFDNVSEKYCIKLDKLNDKIYKKLLHRVRTAEKTVKNTGLHISLDTPILPTPTNGDKFILWTKRNVEKHVILQSEAVLFLNDKGYKLNEHYEAYQAIELYKEIIKNSNIEDSTLNHLENTKIFNNIYTKNDSNLLRRRSIYGNKHFIKANKNVMTKNEQKDNTSEDDYIINDIFPKNPTNFYSSLPNNHSIPTPAPSAPPPPLNNEDSYILEKTNLCENKKINSLYPSINEY